MFSPDTGLCAFGCSTLSPSISHRYCCAVSCRASSPFLGHWKLPLSSRLYTSTKPSPSQYQPFDPVFPPPAKQEKRVLEWIQMKLRLHHPSQPVDPPPQVCVPTGKVYRAAAFEIAQHDLSARMIVWIVSASAPAWISTCSSPHWMLAAIPAFYGLTGTSAKHTSFSDDTAWNTFLCQL